MTVFATANFGRAKSAAPVRTSMDAVEHALHDRDAVLCCQEWDEGDKGYSDHQIGAQIFTAPWQAIHEPTHEPILLNTTRQVVGTPQATPAARPVARWSPARSILDLVLASDTPGNADTAVLGGHYPAGPHQSAGHRSPRVMVQLGIGYARMLLVHRRRIRHHLKAGRNVVWCMDTNWRRFPKLHRREVQVFHTGPDYIRAIPAHGRRVAVGDTGTVPMSIEPLHDAHWAQINFPKQPKP